MTTGRRIAIVLAAVVVAAVVYWFTQDDATEPARPVATYVEANACRSCHVEQTGRWLGSHHQLAMQEANAETVLADFDGTTFDHHGTPARFHQSDGAFRVETDNAEGDLETFDVEYVFGVDPLQQYLVPMPDGRVQCLLTGWDTKKGRWFFLYDEPIPPGDQLHWTGPLQNWNFMCAECHSTNLKRNYDFETDTYDTTWSEISVGCQACHGPGSEHVKWARENMGKPGAADATAEEKGFVVDLQDADPTVEIEHCARCHSRRSLVTPEYRHGDRFLDHYDLQLLHEPLYHLDGQILDEVYVYGSFLQTKKHLAGVRCTDCHDPHSARLKYDDNALCTQCHQQNPPLDRFPTLKGKAYDTQEHHYHVKGTQGSYCVDCHMPSRVYMQVDPRRDHSFRVPRPDLSVRLGTPNACNGCHEDKDADWAAAEVESWYPDSERRQELHFAEAMAVAATGDHRAANVLAAVVADEKRPGIVRATAVSTLGGFPGPIAQQIMQAALTDEEPLVRAAAIDAWVASIPNVPLAPGTREMLAEQFGPLLTDPIRLVRVEAARAMARTNGEAMPTRFQGAYANARAEYVARQEAHMDRADGPFNLALLSEAEGDTAKARDWYGKAIDRFPDFLPARMNRATLYNRLGDNRAAEADLRAAVERFPEAGEAWYSLGLLLAELERFGDAVDPLTKAADLLAVPDRKGRAGRNLGIVLRTLDRDDEAKAVYLEALRWIPNDPKLLLETTLLFMELEDWQQMLRFAQRLSIAMPGDPEVRRLFQMAQQRVAGG